MWSQYDENISKNQFYKEIKENHSDILTKAAEENWIICVPRCDTIKECDIHINTVLDHVLIHATENKYCTLSKKPLEIRNKRIYLQNDQIFNGSVEILFEETFYTEKANKYSVWCMDKPLFLKPVGCDSHKTVVLDSLQDCVRFLWAESGGHEVLENIKKLCKNFEDTHQELQTESLQTLKEEIGNVYSLCLQISFKNVILKEKCGKNPIFLENLKISVEAYMQFCLGKKIMFNINTIQHMNDATLNKIIRNSKNITFQDLYVSNKLCDVITIARCQLSRINNYFTVLGKINCLKKMFNSFYRSSDTLCITSDDLLQILVFLLLKLNVCNWTANLTFIKEFRLSSLDCSDQNSFFVATLEAAIEFLKSNKFLEIRNKDINEPNNSLSDLYDEICKGNFNSVLGKEELIFCHPLCDCEKCKNLRTKDSDVLNEKGQNLLIYATLKNNVKVVELLLSLDFDLNFSDFLGKTALHYAAENGLQDILLLLLTYKANINALDNIKNTPLHLACDRGQDNCVKALIYSSFDLELNLGNSQNETPIFLATKWGFFEIVKILLENGASVCVKNNRKQSVYSLAPNHYILKLFKDFGMNNSTNLMKECGNDNANPKMSERKDVATAQYGVRPKTADEFKKVDLLFRAIENNDLPLTCFYLGFSGNANLDRDENANKCHPLCDCPRCATEEHDNTEKKPPKSTKIFNMCDSAGRTPLHVAAEFDRPEIVRVLLDGGAAANARTYGRLETPLRVAVGRRRGAAARELLKGGGCDVDAADAGGGTALLAACLRGDAKMAELLLANGADCRRPNGGGRSVLQEVEARGMAAMGRVLRGGAPAGERDGGDDFDWVVL